MEDDDPEARVDELERQLAQPRAVGAQHGSAAVTGVPLTPEQVRNVAFSKPPVGKRGYNEDEVDAFLDRVEAALANPGEPSLTADEVHQVAFSKPPIGKRGYNEDEVDAFVDLVEQQLNAQRGASAPRPQPASPSPTITGDGAPPATPARKAGAVSFFATLPTSPVGSSTP